MNKVFIYTVLAIICIALESFRWFDLFFQSFFFKNNAWLIPKSFHQAHRTWLYITPKILVGTIGLVAFAIFFYTFVVQLVKKQTSVWKTPAFLIFLSILIIPLFIAYLKLISGVYSPANLQIYEGQHIYVSFLSNLFTTGQPSTGRSFPAGHASGGFSLMAFYYLPVSQTFRNILWGIGFAAGWLMGFYQMARGEHFLSHTLTTMFITLAIITFLAQELTLTHPTQLPR